MTTKFTVSCCIVVAVVAGVLSAPAAYMTIYRDRQTPDDTKPEVNRFIAVQTELDAKRSYYVSPHMGWTGVGLPPSTKVATTTTKIHPSAVASVARPIRLVLRPIVHFAARRPVPTPVKTQSTEVVNTPVFASR